ncbi:hypothetical protein RJ639_027786 [Escallonia herrerae]|uniref:Ribonuclease H1 N-terminal domain-containing protein n=1 Tax=Escallonia herrerae TaxID=1293975 RepID=A0AA88X4U9_9ASTE|nr:hypothetical protein RJ639_027786 [Escallonia herrerae]
MDHLKKAIQEMRTSEEEHLARVRLHEETIRNLDQVIQKSKEAAEEMRLARIEMEKVVASMDSNKKTETVKSPEIIKLSWADQSEQGLTQKPSGYIPVSEQDKLMKAKSSGPSHLTIQDHIMDLTEKLGLEKPEEVLSLRPNEPLKAKVAKWYTIFNGPRRGVYDNWAEASKYILGSSVGHRSYKTEEEAKLALNMDKEERFKPFSPIQGTFKDKLEQRKREGQVLLQPVISKPNKVIARQFLGPRMDTRKLPEIMTRNETRKWILDIQTMAVDPNFEEDLTMFAVAEELPGKTGWNVLGFDQGADPEKVRKAYDTGLCKVIILSRNLNEISLFPSTILEAVKRFQSNTGIEDITLTLDSCMPTWTEEGKALCKPYNFTWIQRTRPDQTYHRWIWKDNECPDFIEELLNNFRARQLLSLINIIRRKNGNPIYINGNQSSLIVASRSSKKTSEKDEDVLQRFITKIISNNLGYHKEAAKQICTIMRQSRDTNGFHKCQKCPTEEKDKGKGIAESEISGHSAHSEQNASNDVSSKEA